MDGWCRTGMFLVLFTIAFIQGVVRREMSFYAYKFNKTPRICGVCGKKFVPKAATSKYCSGPCKKKMRDKQIEKRRVKLSLVGSNNG